ncbi:hypothetical protein CAL12_27300 [Bordetella genomosp. 8]|uniref:General secretion pathway protein GspC n=1 Tax=Bordetella genomosp. 8 TaxID=1416806 RepID=A0A1W6YU73_9BORD|nr:hypothetical protein [Bordetella genomosp. 8]ARP84153.1 hypothetical protein CAL12_27300 [Bordetella genomosp. 8]
MPQRFDSARLARGAAMLVLAAGVGTWGAILLAPRTSNLPPLLVPRARAAGDTTALARWFGTSAAPVKVTVLGLISAGDRGAAILAIDGAAPRAYRVGQAIADGVTLAKVESAGVVLDQGGTAIRVAVAALPALKTPGFVPVR